MTRFTSSEGDRKRIEYLEKGELFNKYIYPVYQYRARKLIVKSGNNIVLGIHECLQCIFKEMDIPLQFSHYKLRMKNSSYIDRKMTLYTNTTKNRLEDIKKTIKHNHLY